jgi:protein-tyrosine phosphatase|tara:strand:- start:161 stop:943 length:783 start_codon:yes stop_codon:yes gene_type:complete
MTDETLDPKRHLAFDGASNLRDLGGYTTKDGRQTQWRRFVRSAIPNRITEKGQRDLIDYGVGAIIDLRAPADLDAAPNIFTKSDEIAFHHHDFWGDRLKGFKSSPTSPGQAEKLADLYRTGLEKCGGVIVEIMTTMTQGDHATVFHCSAGKDRTGIVAAMLLGVAGVPHDTVAADFALTDRYLEDPKRDHAESDPLTIPESALPNAKGDTLPIYMHSCLPRTMALALEFLDENYGGVEGYLLESGLSTQHIARLRSKLLD